MRGGARDTLKHFLKALESVLMAEEIARQPGLLQRLDPRAKIAGLLAWVLVAAWATRLQTLGLMFAAATLLAVLSRVPIRFLARRVWLSAAAFAGMLAVPALFLTPGDALGYGVTMQGARSAALLVARSVTIASLSALLVLTTPWARILRGLRVLGVPKAAIVVLSMTYRYIFVLIQTAREMLEGRESRTVGKLGAGDTRRLAASAMGVLLGKSLQLSEEVYQAMRSRGFHGEVYLLDEMRLMPADWLAIGAFGSAAVAFRWIA